MGSVFEPEWGRRMADLGLEARFCDRVRACLMEILASGHCSMADVAQRLAVSTRTLQRRLQAEETNFEQELSHLRADLANQYLINTHYSSTEIAFLLGYNLFCWVITINTPDRIKPLGRRRSRGFDSWDGI